MKSIGLFIVVLTGGFLIYAAADFPAWGDPNSPASLHVSPYYLETTVELTHVPNAVTSVVADYRGYDTMFETTVIFTAGMVCFFVLRAMGPKGRREESLEKSEERLYRHILTGVTVRVKAGGKIPESADFERIDPSWTPHDLIIKTICRLLVPFIQIFALYVICFGHYSPGGGFQGGVILGASIIVYAISTDLRSGIKRFKERTDALFAATGVFIYAGTGALCLLLGFNFLDYHALAPILFVDRIMARSHGIFIVEVGVGIAVMSTMLWIYNVLASRGHYDEGL